MSTEEPKKEAPEQAAEPHIAPGHDHETELLKSILSQYGTPVITGIVLAVLIVVGFSTYRSFKADTANRAAAALGEATTAEEFQQVFQNFADSPAAPIAQLGLGSAYFQDEKFDEAQKAYADFVAANPEHTMAPAAEIAMAQALEAKGDTDAALAAFTEFLASRPDNYLASYAAIGKARCYAQAGQLDEARAAYEEVIAAYPETIWANRAESDLEWVQRMQRAQR